MAAELCRGKLFLGISNHGVDDILRHPHAHQADYFAIGPIFPTTSKEDAAEAVGIDAVREIRAAGVHRPLVAIGSITSASAPEIRAAGADGVAVVAAIAGAEDVEAAARGLA